MVVDTTSGIWYFRAVSFPQKQTESDTITSGRNSSTCSRRKSSIRPVVRRATTDISVVETRFSAASSQAESPGRKRSQETYSAPVASTFSRNSSKE